MTESEEVLLRLIKSVNALGGIVVDEDEEPVRCVKPMTSAALADLYHRACAVLGEEMVSTRA